MTTSLWRMASLLPQPGQTLGWSEVMACLWRRVVGPKNIRSLKLVRIDDFLRWNRNPSLSFVFCWSSSEDWSTQPFSFVDISVHLLYCRSTHFFEGLRDLRRLLQCKTHRKVCDDTSWGDGRWWLTRNDRCDCCCCCQAADQIETLMLRPHTLCFGLTCKCFWSRIIWRGRQSLFLKDVNTSLWKANKYIKLYGKMASEQGMGLLLSRSLCDLFNTSANCTNVLICTRTQNMDSGFHAASYLSAKGFKGFKCWLIWGTCKLPDPNLLQTVEHGTEGTHSQSAKYSYVFLMLGPICCHNLQSLDFVWMDMMNQSPKAWHSVWQMDFAGKHWRAAGSSTWTCAEA